MLFVRPAYTMFHAFPEWQFSRNQPLEQHGRIHPACMKSAAAIYVVNGNLRRTEQEGINFVEVTVVAMKKLIKGGAVIPGCRRRKFFDNLFNFVRICFCRVPGLTTVKDRIIGTSNGSQVILRDGCDGT